MNDYQAVAASQSKDGITAILDVRHGFDAKLAEEAGVNLQLLLVSQPNDYDEAAEIAEMLIKSQAVSTIFVQGPQEESK